MNVKLLLLAAIAIGGCANNSALVKQKIDAGDCAGARDIANNSYRDPGYRASVLAVVAHDCERDNGKAREYLTLSARYGNAKAREKMVEMGWDVPPADLAQSSGGDAAANAQLMMMGLQLMQRGSGVPPGGSNGVTCHKKTEWVSGFNKNCVYNCLGSDAVQTISSTSLCPLTMTR